MNSNDERGSFLPPEIQAEAGAGRPTAALVAEVAAGLSAAREAYLARLPVAEIVEILDRSVGLWLEAGSPWLDAACRRIGATTPYSEAMVRVGITRLLEGCRKDGLLTLLEAELGDPEVLDGFRPRPGARGSHRALGPALTTHIFSGNVPGLPAVSLVHGLLVKSANLGKPAADEPVFAALFARSIASVDSRLAAAVAILPWTGGDAAVEAAAFAVSEAVIAYGSDDSIESIRSRVPPGVRFVGHGHRLSLAVIGREAMDPGRVASLAERVAHDVSLFDQQGCVSPHVVYVERGGAIPPEAFAERLGEAMAVFERRMPRGRLTTEEGAAIRQARAEAEFSELRGDRDRLFASPAGTAWTVIYEVDPAFVSSCLNRVVRVKGLADLGDLPDLLRPVSRHLQTVGVALSPERRNRLADLLAPLGVCRVCPVGEMPHPPLHWHHDGGFSLLPLLKWTAIEE
ncbi:MAG: acyl-CoA reductase [candidate division NC10 bacterium]|nr:acyl-CoA reductase [candidate division NC10 bacterium]